MPASMPREALGQNKLLRSAYLLAQACLSRELYACIKQRAEYNLLRAARGAIERPIDATTRYMRGLDPRPSRVLLNACWRLDHLRMSSTRESGGGKSGPRGPGAQRGGISPSLRNTKRQSARARASAEA